MKIALVGYGKMGHMIAKLAEARSHSIVCTVDLFAKDASCITNDHKAMLACIKESGAEGIIEFSHPASVLDNIKALLPLGLPLVVGTTGWLDSLPEVRSLVDLHKTSFLYASNFSIGVNLFYSMVEHASKIMAEFDDYDVAVFESHHNQKVDSPSGTALDIAQRVLDAVPRKTKIYTDSFARKPEPNELHVASLRIGSDPGAHSVLFDSLSDTIEIKHTARNREGFALGAVHALEWLRRPDAQGRAKTGVFTMKDVLSF